MPKRLPYEAAILAALLLGSCDNMPACFIQADSRRLDYAEANLENAARASCAMVDRVERGERRMDELERELREQGLRDAEAHAGTSRELVNINDHYNQHLRASH